jgi:hypothetical protein
MIETTKIAIIVAIEPALMILWQVASHERAQNAQSLRKSFVTFVLLCGIHTFRAKPFNYDSPILISTSRTSILHTHTLRKMDTSS